MNLRSITVVTTHSLGAEEATVRLRRLLSGNTDSSVFVVKRLSWDDDSKTATFTLDIGVGSVSGRAVVTDDFVKIETDKLPMLAWGPVALYAQKRIQATLAEALK